MENIVVEPKKEKFSYSKLETYENCPFRYKLNYVDKHFPDTSAIATDFGTLVHFIEESIARDIVANDNEPIFMIDNEKYINLFINGYKEWKVVGKFTAEDALKYNEKRNLTETDKDFKHEGDNKYKLEHILGVMELKEKYPDDWRTPDKNGLTYAQKCEIYANEGIHRLQNYLAEHRDLRIVGIEKEFNLEYRNYVFHGFIDRVFLDIATGELIIEDIKTWDNIEGHNLTTPLQFVLYRLAAEQLYEGRTNISCFYDLPLAGNRYAAGTSGYIKRGIKKIDSLLDKIESKAFEPKPSPLCHWCVFSKTFPNQPDDAKNLCPYFSHWTRENKDFSVEYEWMGIEQHEAILESFTRKNLVAQQENNDIITIIKEPIKVNSERRFILRRS